MSELASTFAKMGQPSYAGITNETYVGAERREASAVTLKGDWWIARQYGELKKGSGEIVVPFVAGEVNLVMQPGPSGRAAVTVLLDGKPIGDARGTDVGADGVARFDRSGMIRLVAGVPQRRQRVDTRLERHGAARICVHFRSLRTNRTRTLPTSWLLAHQFQSTLVRSLWEPSGGVAQSNSSDDQEAAMKRFGSYLIGICDGRWRYRVRTFCICTVSRRGALNRQQHSSRIPGLEADLNGPRRSQHHLSRLHGDQIREPYPRRRPSRAAGKIG